MLTAKRLQGQKAYTSTDENNFLRGISVHTKPLRNVNIINFVSYNKKDSRTQLIDSIIYSSAVSEGGLHRTNSEIEKKDNLKETIWGSNILYSHKSIKLGATYINYNYTPYITNDDNLYNTFSFSGNNNYNYSIYYQTRYKKINFYGEIASCKSSGKAFIQGINIDASSQVQVEIIYRNYSKKYNANFANAFADNKKNKNEEGIYFGLELYPIKKIKIHLYLDLFKNEWLKYRVNAPSRSYDFLCQINYNLNKYTSIYLKYKNKKNTENNADNRINYPIDKVKQQIRIHIKHIFNDTWEIRNRIETSKYKKENTRLNAYMLYQDIIYNNNKIPLSIKFRYAIFNTDSYHTRIYAYENDLLYTFSNPAYYYKGSRIYINLKYSYNTHLKLYAKLSQTKYSNKENIGSGNSLIEGNTKTEIKFQAIYKF